jgi:homopolymeric O-antigen transport system ATP-binding protein
MIDWAIRLTNVGKLYPIAGAPTFNGSLRDEATTWLGNIVGRKPVRPVTKTPAAGQNRDRKQQDFWALRDISLEVAKGEILGIVGRNGAGKSTLLKILARITPPTSGKIEFRGRLGALLEIGTGFHRELSGRENVFLNGSILGMRRGEVATKLDEIVAFAEIEKFLDTPVKFYSSGMYVRLAFAVAAHLDTDILLVDEVLAVGDVRFQKKCLGKIQNVATGEGRTVLFVSHNMNAVQRLCSHGVFLNDGAIVAKGGAAEIVTKYLSALSTATASSGDWLDLRDADRFGTGEVRFLSIRYGTDGEAAAGRLYPDGSVDFSLVVESDEAKIVGSVAVTFYSLDGAKLVNADTISLGKVVELTAGRSEIRLRINQLHLNPGNYVLGLYLASPHGLVFDHIQSTCEVAVVEIETRKLGQRPVYDGSVCCDFDVIEVTNDDNRRPHD